MIIVQDKRLSPTGQLVIESHISECENNENPIVMTAEQNEYEANVDYSLPLEPSLSDMISM